MPSTFCTSEIKTDVVDVRLGSPQIKDSPLHTTTNTSPASTSKHTAEAVLPKHTDKDMAPNQQKIDIHHHIFPPAALYPKDALNAQAGWRTPAENMPWTPAVSLRAMDTMGIAAAVLSYPAGVPVRRQVGADVVGEERYKEERRVRDANRHAARELNEYARRICEEGEGRGRFGWMACLPDWRDTQGALDELAYALDTLHADGVSVSSSYGEEKDAVYVGDDMFDPIWEELDKRGVTVFLHGAQTPSSTPYPHPFLGLPVTEVPNETFKAAAHLVVTGKKRRFARVRIVLAHLGGSTPFLAPRVAALAAHMGCTLAPDACLADFSSFFLDTALAAHKSTLGMCTISPDRLLFGTDFPAVSKDTASWYTRNVEEFYANDPTALAAVQRENAYRLFPRLCDRLQQRP